MEENRPAGDQIGVPRVTADEIVERLDRGEPIVFIDARNPQAWGEAEEKIAGAIRIPADELDEHLDEIPKGRSVVAYCT
jgi:rhodanese-related sulfurtransferase